MDKPTPIPISKSVRAAQYVRMSTEHQQYSTENQAEVIARYAAEHGMEIVATYEDSGKSGLTLTGREELKKLLADAESGSADFSVVLVYDVSRWGRFLDADESAYHEYVCKRAGVSVHYPAEQFKNDGSPISEDAGPDMTIDALMSVIAYFRITRARAKEILREVEHAVDDWRMTGHSIGMSDEELEPFVDAFEHGERDAAKKLF